MLDRNRNERRVDGELGEAESYSFRGLFEVPIHLDPSPVMGKERERACSSALSLAAGHCELEHPSQMRAQILQLYPRRVSCRVYLEPPDHDLGFLERLLLIQVHLSLIHI